MKFDYKSYSNHLESENERLNATIDELEERIDKAIEYIKEMQNSCIVFSNIAYKELLEILGEKK